MMNLNPATAGGFACESLYVGDLDPNVSDDYFFHLFNSVAPVRSYEICRNQPRRQSFLCHAFVHFRNYHDAANAMKHLYFTKINGKQIRIMFSHNVPSFLKSKNANIFIKNLDSSIDNEALHRVFASFGTILSCKVAIDASGKSKKHGFVQFEKVESAQNAIKSLNGLPINGTRVYVGPFIASHERVQEKESPKITNVFVKNLPEATTDEGLKQLFSTYGIITSAVVMRDREGKSRCFGFVNFQDSDAASAAVEKLNGTTICDDKILYVGLAQSKAQRCAEFLAKNTQKMSNTLEEPKGANLYVKNFDVSVDEEKLKELFSMFGTIKSCKVMRDQDGLSKGFGFVAFSTAEEASRARHEMNGKMIDQRRLYVGVAQRKEERMTQLNFPRSIRPPANKTASLYNGIPGSLPVPMPYLYGAPGLIPPAGFGLQKHPPNMPPVAKSRRPLSSNGDTTFASSTSIPEILQLILSRKLCPPKVQPVPSQAPEARTVPGELSIS